MKGTDTPTQTAPFVESLTVRRTQSARGFNTIRVLVDGEVRLTVRVPRGHRFATLLDDNSIAYIKQKTSNRNGTL